MKSKGIAVFLAVFLGNWGAHRFYLGQSKAWWMFILNCTLIGAPVATVWGWVDAVKMLRTSGTEWAARY